MDDMTAKRVDEYIDKEGSNGHERKKRVKEKLDKEGGPNGRHGREESPSRVT